MSEPIVNPVNEPESTPVKTFTQDEVDAIVSKRLANKPVAPQDAVGFCYAGGEKISARRRGTWRGDAQYDITKRLNLGFPRSVDC